MMPASIPSTFPSTVVQTRRLVLRPLRPGDAQALFEIHGDPRVARYLARPSWRSIDEAHEYLARDALARNAGTALRLAIDSIAEGQTVGECSLFNIAAASRRAEVGIALGAKHWSKAYASEAIEALVHFAFAELRFNRLEADIDPRNEASARIFRKLGFRHEGHMPERWLVDGQVSHTDFYGLLVRDWVHRQGSSSDASPHDPGAGGRPHALGPNKG